MWTVHWAQNQYQKDWVCNVPHIKRSLFILRLRSSCNFLVAWSKPVMYLLILQTLTIKYLCCVSNWLINLTHNIYLNDFSKNSQKWACCRHANPTVKVLFTQTNFIGTSLLPHLGTHCEWITWDGFLTLFRSCHIWLWYYHQGHENLIFTK